MFKINNNTYSRTELTDWSKNIRNEVCQLLRKVDKPYTRLVLLCTGTDEVMYDTYGPIVGSNMSDIVKSSDLPYVEVHGTVANNLRISTLSGALECDINTENALVIAIASTYDTAPLGELRADDKMSMVTNDWNTGGINPGYFDIAITCCLAQPNTDKATRLHDVMEAAVYTTELLKVLIIEIAKALRFYNSIILDDGFLSILGVSEKAGYYSIGRGNKHLMEIHSKDLHDNFNVSLGGNIDEYR